MVRKVVATADERMFAACFAYTTMGVRIYTYHDILEEHEELQWKLTHSQGCYDIDMTPDGQWLVMIDMFDDRVIVYRFD